MVSTKFNKSNTIKQTPLTDPKISKASLDVHYDLDITYDGPRVRALSKSALKRVHNESNIDDDLNKNIKNEMPF